MDQKIKQLKERIEFLNYDITTSLNNHRTLLERLSGMTINAEYLKTARECFEELEEHFTYKKELAVLQDQLEKRKQGKDNGHSRLKREIA